ncbi:Potassium voltage-gated channel sub H member 7 [Rhizoclosmatium sp. JEL0117]|nr:Potassium voltage-gated channel sub H member 7 [Rhizoclosmatium sp. JEL0117]
MSRYIQIPVTVHSEIINNIKTLRAEVWEKSEKLLDLLGTLERQHSSTSAPIKHFPSEDHLQQGIRWSGSDFLADIDANKSQIKTAFSKDRHKDAKKNRSNQNMNMASNAWGRRRPSNGDSEVDVQESDVAITESSTNSHFLAPIAHRNGTERSQQDLRLLPSILEQRSLSRREISDSNLRVEHIPVGLKSSMKGASIASSMNSNAHYGIHPLTTNDVDPIKHNSLRIAVSHSSSLDANTSESEEEQILTPFPASERKVSLQMAPPAIINLRQESIIHAKKNSTVRSIASAESVKVQMEPTLSRKVDTLGRRKTMKVPSILAKSHFNLVVNAQIFNWSLVAFLYPAFDGKGQWIQLSQFDKVDMSNVSFLVNGLHPRSFFNTYFDFTISLLQRFDLFKLNEILPTIFFIETCVNMCTPQPRISNPICNYREYEMMRPPMSSWVSKWLMYKSPFDVITLIPFEFVFGKPELLLINILRLTRLPIIISRCAVYRYWELKIDGMSGMSISQTIPIAIAMLFFLHFNACSMFYFGQSFNFLHWEVVWPEVVNASVYEFYSWTFFQAVGNMFPQSFAPQTATEQVSNITYTILAACLYAIFIGSVSAVAMSINPSGRLYVQKMEELKDYIKWKDLSQETESKLYSYYETKYRGKFFEEQTLLNELNESLRAEVSLHNSRDLILKVPFLKRQENDGRDEIYIGRIATKLRAQHYIAGDYITKQGESGFDMFFIVSGKVDVFVGSKKVVSLFDGAYIGEVALITKILRTATVQAAVPSVLYRLTYNDFHEILSEFPDVKEKIDRLAQERENVIKNTEHRRMSERQTEFKK